MASRNYEVIVVGGGHASAEAALASARMGRRTLLLTMSLDTIGEMPCNPAVGGSAKGQMVNEIDALGGEMGKNTDRSLIQIRWLNTGKGPAMRSLRAQCDKWAYRQAMRRAVEGQDNLFVVQTVVNGFLRRAGGAIGGVTTALGFDFTAPVVVVGSGTFLNGLIHTGEYSSPAGRSTEVNAVELARSFAELGLELGRLKTGTPARLAHHSIDFDQIETLPREAKGLKFSAFTDIPMVDPQNFMDCYVLETNPRTHEVIRQNFHRSPMFQGVIKGIGPRYCPSIEDKVNKFPEKEGHRFFLEPEGRFTGEMYAQGMSTSLPEEVQWEFLRTIRGLERCRLVKPGYAVEYDFVLPHQLRPTLEVKSVEGLFLAGQINGTSGYEEAAGQGIVAGINGALKAREKSPLLLSRLESYIGVMIDDLITTDIHEPYRMFTSRAENRLYLRSDNGPERLFPIGRELGLIEDSRYRRFEDYLARLSCEKKRLAETPLEPLARINRELVARGYSPVHGHEPKSLAFLLTRPDLDLATLNGIFPELYPTGSEIAEPLAIAIKYEGYIQRQNRMMERQREFMKCAIPDHFDFNSIKALSFEAREKLTRFRPATLEAARKAASLTPADLHLILFKLRGGGHEKRDD